MRICSNDKFMEFFAQRFHYFGDPFYKAFALNLLFQDTSYSLALKYSSFLFKFFSFVFYNINFWFKISKICPKISHFSQISHSRGNTGMQVEEESKKKTRVPMVATPTFLSKVSPYSLKPILYCN